MGAIDSRSASGGMKQGPGRRVSRSRLRADHLCLLLVVIAGFLLRVHRIGSEGLWIDEAFSVWLARRPLAELVRWVVTVDQHPPLYYALLHGWIRVFGDGEAGARALSAALGTLTIPVMYLLGRRLVNRRVGIAGALILAVSPFHVRFAQEARMYTLLTLNAAAALYAFVMLVDRDGGLFSLGDGSREGERCDVGCCEESEGPWLKRGEGWRRGLAWVGSVVFTAAALWTHNAAVLLPLALNLVVVVAVLSRERRALRPGSWRPAAVWLRRWVLVQAAILLLWLPWLPSFISQAAGVYRRFWLPAPTAGTVLSVVSVLLCDFLPLPLAGIVLVDGVLVGVALLGLRGMGRQQMRAGLLGAAFVVPLMAEWALSIWRPILYARTLIWTSIPLILMMAAGVWHVGRVLSWRIASLMALVVVLAASAAGLTNYYRTFEKEEWDAAATLVAERVEPGDLLLFNDGWGQIPFDYYFGELYNRPVTAHGVPADLFDRGVLESEMTEADLPRLRRLMQGHERVWLVYSHDWYTDPQGLVPATLEGEMVLRNRWEFRGLEVSLYGR